MIQEGGIGLLRRSDDEPDIIHDISGNPDSGSEDSSVMIVESVKRIDARCEDLREAYRAIDSTSTGVAAAERMHSVSREALGVFRDSLQTLLRVMSDSGLEKDVRFGSKQKLEEMIAELLTMIPSGDELIAVLREEASAIQQDLASAYKLNTPTLAIGDRVMGSASEANADTKADAVLRLRSFRAFLKNSQGIDLSYYIATRNEYAVSHTPSVMKEESEDAANTVKEEKLQEMRSAISEVWEEVEKISKQYQF